MDLFDLLLVLLGFRRWESEYPNIQARTACWTGGAYFVAAVAFLFVRGASTAAETEWLIIWGLAIALAACSSPALLWLICGRRWTTWPPVPVLLLTFLGALAATFAWRLLFDLFVRRALHGVADSHLLGSPLAWAWSLSTQSLMQLMRNDSLFGSAWDTSKPRQLVSPYFEGAPGDGRHDNVGFRCVIVVK